MAEDRPPFWYDAQLAGDLKKLDAAKIPIDVRFEQGLDVLGLQDAVH